MPQRSRRRGESTQTTSAASRSSASLLLRDAITAASVERTSARPRGRDCASPSARNDAMNSFVRLFGGALGALIAIALTGGAGIPPLDSDVASPEPSCSSGGSVAWFVIGFSILPYVTVVPARWLISHVMELSTGEFISAVARPDRRPRDRPAARPADDQPARAIQLAPADRHGPRHRPRNDGPDRRQARRPRRCARSAGQASFIHPTSDRRCRRGAGPTTYVDTSALIDGRITDVVASGFLFGTLVVPRFVVGELQHIADNRDQSTPRPRPTRPRGAQPCFRRTTASRSS